MTSAAKPVLPSSAFLEEAEEDAGWTRGGDLDRSLASGLGDGSRYLRAERLAVPHRKTRV